MHEEPDKLRAQLHRTAAAKHRLAAQTHAARASAIEAGAAFRKVYETVTAAEARDVAEHPDLAELNVQLDAFYGGTT
ncbi:hypothetical protein [Streptomyces sp. AGS-58]|uniref:hypothetical protein n=1 Tax=unclassified Streptomyces TaxID=2593676 RepID=UPI0035A299E5